MTKLEYTRKERRKSTGEDFTPIELVNEMLDKLSEDVWQPEKLWVDPAGGNGNFVVEILKRKLAKGHPPLIALSTIFGVELQQDNTDECKERLLAELPELSNEDLQKAKDIINHNIVAHNAFTWDFENWKSKDKKSKKLFE